MFPVEIWEEILKHGNARDLVRLRTVCRTWDAIIAPILEQSDVWYRQCVEDIPENLWCSLLEHQIDGDIECQDFHKSRSSHRIWLQMYKSWRGWKNIMGKRPQIGTFEPLPEHRPLEHITCVATLSNIIAIGSTEGYIAFYDTRSDKIFYKADHAEFLQNVQMFRKGNFVVAASTSIYDRTKFWNLFAKREERRRRCTASLITSSFNTCYMISSDQLAWYRLSEDAEGQIHGWLDDLSDSVQGEQIVAAGANGNEVTLCTKNKQIHVIYNEENAYSAYIFHTPEVTVPIRYFRIFKPRVAACIGVFGQFGFCIDGGNWKIYDLFKKFFAPVTTVIFHVAFLAVGLQSGEVHLFPVKDVESLEHLDFDTIESRKLLLDTEPIISLNVMEHDSAQYLVAASNRHVHLVKFT